jgi:hypothetical protein
MTTRSGQGPTKVIMVCNTPPYGHAPTYQILLTYLERNHYLTSRSKDKVPRRSLRWCMTTRSVLCTIMTFVWTLTSRSNNCFFRDRSMIFGMWVHENKAVCCIGTRHTSWSCTHIPNIIHLSRKTKNVMAGTRKYYLKNHYLTFRVGA